MKHFSFLRSTLLLLLLIASAPSHSQNFTFDVRNSKTADTYNVAIDLKNKTITAKQGNSSVFSHSFASATVLDRGIAFSFNQGQAPSLVTKLDDWFFSVKPTAIGFNNPDTEIFVMAAPLSSVSFTSSYNSLVAAINGTASSNVSSNNAPNNNTIITNNVSTNNVPASGSTRTFTANGVSFTMVQVPGGTFTMGGTSEQGSDAYGEEKRTHKVTLSSYYIGQTEVTQELWQAVMGNNPSFFKGNKRPVEQVSWDDCQTFLRKLNSMTGQTFRLPTEAEWEYAARGGKSEGTKYSGSNFIEDTAWYGDNSGNQTHDVATKRANSLGIYDMSGNVDEWCNDWLGKYNKGSQTNPQGPSKGSSRVLRGGSWKYSAGGCRVSFRNFRSPDGSYNNLGLRLAL